MAARLGLVRVQIDSEGGATDMVLNTDKLASGKTWRLLESEKSAVGERGVHAILLVLRVDEPEKYCRRDELTREDKAELVLMADAFGAQFAHDLGNEGYYRLELNGPSTATRDHFHIHVIAGRSGVKFRRCVDSIIVESKP